MKLLVILIILFVATGFSSSLSSSSSSSSSSSPSKYIYSETYQPTDTTCTNSVVSSEFALDGLCEYGSLSRCINGNQAVEITYYSEMNCTGEPFDKISIPVDSCIEGFPGKLYCVDEINIPTSNALLTIFSETCDWKETLESFQIRTMNTCFDFNNQMLYFTCNATNLVEEVYPSGSSCSGSPISQTAGFIPQNCNDVMTGNNVTYICV
ncbi:hypothetical protein DICPUDRAFT_158436 [Dictyostelium purpureum]|uniref:SUEL-type lectin domain-containing protein n=1 Tax=Dictyostelium purpureum TaxID=5786 RepID=F1A1M0_DICPU|nr:uncharacterized protein DICPUDRAFT_158436 [Dictyostelium purpureum]EGC29903.1 hypothetical protein DICPUDRAFT_158436 [Dictyostelium purpureum]|eukprot:XP_003293564.1 hypothetical protein DICPUDRAFT_158436 [Dictyostelium purpureum]